MAATGSIIVHHGLFVSSLPTCNYGESTETVHSVQPWTTFRTSCCAISTTRASQSRFPRPAIGWTNARHRICMLNAVRYTISKIYYKGNWWDIFVRFVLCARWLSRFLSHCTSSTLWMNKILIQTNPIQNGYSSREGTVCIMVYWNQIGSADSVKL